MPPNNLRHGMRYTRFYETWRGMRRRCMYPNNKRYYCYGGRGIKVCERWNEFENFRDDMYQSYLEHVAKFGEKETTIERNDTNGNYELSNCGWATRSEQVNNRNYNRIVEYQGIKYTVSQLAQKVGLTYIQLWQRLFKYKFTLEEAINLKFYGRQAKKP